MMPQGRRFGAAQGEERLSLGQAMVVVCVLSALSWAVLIGIVMLLI